VIDVPIRGNDGDLEYKVQMKAGATVVYSWEVQRIGKPEEFYTEFHGHTEPVGGRGDLMFYEKGTGAKASGALVAPWEGIHGWYWQNQSTGPVVVRLRLAGFYELVPGQAGQPVRE
jgi:bacillopeptidase F (M6 metalloprotease family)